MNLKIYLLVGFLLLVNVFAFAQDKQAILKVLETQREGWNSGNMEQYMEGYWKSDSVLFVSKSGLEYGWKTVLDNYKKFYPDKAAMGFLTLDVKEVRLLDSNNAFVVGRWHIKSKKEEQKGYFTLLLKKIGGQWKVVVDHSS